MLALGYQCNFRSQFPLSLLTGSVHGGIIAPYRELIVVHLATSLWCTVVVHALYHNVNTPFIIDIDKQWIES